MTSRPARRPTRGPAPRPLAALLLLPLAVVGVACDRPGTGPRSAPDTAAPGTLAGRVALIGGPVDPRTGRMAAVDAPGAGIAVTVLVAGRPAASATAARDGRFRITLAPGRYAVRVCGCARPVTVPAAAQVTVRLRCAIR